MHNKKKNKFICFALLTVFFLFIGQTTFQVQGEETAQILVELTTSPADPKTDERLELIQAAKAVNGELVLADPFGECDFLKEWSEDLKAEKKESIAEQLEAQAVKAANDDKAVTRIAPSKRSGRQLYFSGLQPGLYLLTGNDGKNFRLYPPVVVEVKSAPGENADLIQIFPKVEYPDIAVLKTDADDKAITGLPFEFRIYADEECKDELAVLTGEEKTGQTNFYTLSSKGTVYLKETKAPQGYKLSDEGIPVSFDGNTVSINEDQIVEAENNSGRYIISVKNEKDKGPIEDEDTSSSSSSDTTEDDASSSSTNKDKDSKNSKDSNNSKNSSSQKPGQSNGKTNTAAGTNLFGIMTVFAAAALCMTMLLVLMTQKRKQNK